ncbi:MAG: hypothetical protein NC095_04700 [Muribaculum sp.]|nr:hypothetical protein [Muribaculum sp.]
MEIIKTAITLTFLLNASMSIAQKLETRDFTATNEVTARLKDTEMIDSNNGKGAALIKIYTPFPDEMLGFDLGFRAAVGVSVSL